MNKIISIAALALLFTVSSCHRDSTGSANCPGAVSASWKADGTTYEMHNSFTAGSGGGSSFMNVVLVACSSDGVDRSVAFNFIPYPPVAGVYPVKYTSAHGIPWNGTVSGIYLTGNTVSTEMSYYTDSTAHTGTFSITGVNAGAKTFSGTFEFTAVNDSGSSTVHITDGTYTAGYN